MIMFLHSRYRTTGGEERVVEDLRWLVQEHLQTPTALLERDSAELSRLRAVGGLLRGGLDAAELARLVRQRGVRVVHAHNLLPTFGWRALAAARAAGARTVAHLHQYRLVCATGVCFRDGRECTSCHARHTLPGVIHNCRSNVAEAVSYAAALSLWQRRLIGSVDAFIVPSAFAREQLRALGARLPWERVHVLAPPLRALAQPPPARAEHREQGRYALVTSRLAPEKGIDVAIEACRLAGIRLLIAGAGPQLPALRALAGDGEVEFLGQVSEQRLRRLRAGAAIALMPSRSPETFGLAAAEAMAAGVPVAGSDVGALGELIDARGLVPAGDAEALAAAIGELAGDTRAAAAGRARVRELCEPARVAAALAAVYEIDRWP